MIHPRDFIIQFCDELKVKLLDKWDRGAAEHGDGWDGVDCIKEVNEEVRDIINYFCIQKAKDAKAQH